MSRIKDISLASWGRKELDLAEVEMPGLMSIREEFGASQPLKGAKISGSLHVTIQTACLVETLKALGAKLRWCSCNIFSTQDQAAAALVEANSADVFAWKGETLEEYWDLTDSCLNWGGEGPDLIVDDGGDATVYLIEGLATEKKFKETGSIAEPARASLCEDEYWLLMTIKKNLEKDKNYFTNLTKNLKGVSEETTTGVARLYKF